MGACRAAAGAARAVVGWREGGGVGLGLQGQVRMRGAPSRHMGRGYEYEFSHSRSSRPSGGFLNGELLPWEDTAGKSDRRGRDEDFEVFEDMKKLKAQDRVDKQVKRKEFYEKPNQIKYRLGKAGPRSRKMAAVARQVEWVTWGRKVGYIGGSRGARGAKGKASRLNPPIAFPNPEGY